jgi:hypothetical protein
MLITKIAQAAHNRTGKCIKAGSNNRLPAPPRCDPGILGAHVLAVCDRGAAPSRGPDRRRKSDRKGRAGEIFRHRAKVRGNDDRPNVIVMLGTLFWRVTTTASMALNNFGSSSSGSRSCSDCTPLERCHRCHRHCRQR